MFRRQALALTLLSWLGWSTFELARPAVNPSMDLSAVFTDHFSHMNAGRLFLRHGVDLWRKPIDQMLRRPTLAEWDALADEVKQRPDSVFLEPGWQKPVLHSWAQVVRFYPPGDLLLTAPAALLYHFTPLSFAGVNRLLLILLLAAAHAGLFVLLEGLLAQQGGAHLGGLITAYLAVNLTLRWTLEGFYDSALILPLLLCWRWLGERRGLAAGVAFCAAAFLHFRAYYYAPWALWAGWLVVREQQWKSWRGKDWLAAACALFMGVSSLYVFALTWPALVSTTFQNSPLYVSRTHLDAPALALFGGLVLVAAAAAWLARSLPDLALLGWFAVMLTSVRQSQPWYSLTFLPWLCAPPRGIPTRAPLVFHGRLPLFLFLALSVYADGQYLAEAIAPTWVPRLLQ